MINTYGVISGVSALQQETLKNSESNLIPAERLDPISTWSGGGGGGGAKWPIAMFFIDNCSTNLHQIL